MLKISLITTLCVFAFVNLHAQPPGDWRSKMPKVGKITGLVIDSISNKPLEFASVSVYRLKDSSLVGGMITNEKGKFLVEELPYGRFRVEVNFMGYGTWKRSPIMIYPGQTSIDLEKIVIAPTSETLEMAEVTADKQVFQLGLDKKVFNVDKTNLGDSENATEVLRNTPTVEVDFDGNVKIRGSAVQVYINGKPTGLTGDSQAEILDQLPANTIKSVELITNPSAKYDPEGESGIINIVLKKNILDGFTGSVNASAGTSTWYPFRRYRGGLSLNFRNNKINIFSNFSYNDNRNYSRGYNLRSNFFAADTSYIVQQSENERARRGGMARIGFDYYFDDFNTLTFATRISPSGGGNSGFVNYDYEDVDREVTSYQRRITEGDRNKMNMTYNVIYSKVFKKKKKEKNGPVNRIDNSKDVEKKGYGHWRGGNDRAVGRSGTMGDKQELVIDLQYSNNTSNDQQIFNERFYDPNWTELNTLADSSKTINGRVMHQGTARVDYTHPLSKKMKIECGYKGNIRLIQNDFEALNYDYTASQFLSDSNRTNAFDFLEQVHAMYVTFTQKIGKFNYKLGLRVEHTTANSALVTTSQTFENQYFSFFPTANMSYDMGNNQQMQLSFSRRIRRPSIWLLNPFPSYSDPLNLRYGNPFLLPQYSNNLELSYTRYWNSGHTIVFSGFYRFNTDLMENLRTVDEATNVSTTTYYNFNNSHVYGGELITRFVPYKWWNFGVTGSVYGTYQDATNLDSRYVLNALAGNVNFYSNFVFPFGMRIAIYAWVSMPTLNTQGNTSAYTWNSVTISQKVFKNKGTITLSVRNPLFGGFYEYEVDETNFAQYGRYEWESPVFELRYSHRFGKVTVRDGRSKNSSRLGKGIDDGDSGQGMGQM